MKKQPALLLACTLALALTATTATFAQEIKRIKIATNEPIPGVDIIVKKNPGGSAIKAGDCQSGGGKVVKKAGEWVCTGLPTTGRALPKSRSSDKK